jgi:CheY-like chemotaxis protein
MALSSIRTQFLALAGGVAIITATTIGAFNYYWTEKVALDAAVEALAALERKSYDLILMDMMMTEMDGPTATQAIRKMDDPALANLPIIALTANAMKGDREHYLSVGMTDYVAKPINQDQLIRTILRAINIPLADGPPQRTAPDQSGVSGISQITAPNKEPEAPAPEPIANAVDDFSVLMDDFASRPAA